MISFLIGVIVVLVGLSGVSFIMWRITDKQRVELETQLDTAVKDNKILMEQLNKLHEELRIKSENRKEADEKIKKLHTGDTLGNALNGLH